MALGQNTKQIIIRMISREKERLSKYVNKKQYRSADTSTIKITLLEKLLEKMK